MKKKLFAVALATVMVVSSAVSVMATPKPVYFNDFEKGAGTATIVGNGEIVTDTNAFYGKVFHNAKGGQEQRKNYLLLPEDVLAKSADSKELTISFWVNVGTAKDFFYSPIFSAYAAAPVDNANGMPMMVLQSRLLAQVNCAGWTDFTKDDYKLTLNETGNIPEDTTWLDDAEWHYYTAVFKENTLKIYLDGEVVREWAGDGTDGHTLAGLYSNGADLKYICLGGNQAWGWGDVDAAYMFDDVAIYNTALSQADIKANITAKTTPATTPTTGDMTAVLPVAVLAVAAMAVVVVMKKKAATN